MLPKEFCDYTRKLFGEELWQQYLASFDEPVPVSIRLNRRTTLDDLSHLPIAERIPWSERGYYLSERPQFTLDPLLHAGAYYVQEASSQYLDEVLRKIEGVCDTPLQANVADFCAAPGGKSLILKDHLPEGATLISNEYIRKRAWILAENIEKSQLPELGQELPVLGLSTAEPKIIVTNNSTEELSRCGLIFDLILCDVPCSGEGMFRKDPATIKEWSMENVMKCAALQREIVTNAWSCLKEGGILIYSTCTFNRYEDEDNADFIEKELGGEIIVPARKFIPGRDRGEGQFMVVFRKPAPSPHSQQTATVTCASGAGRKAKFRLNILPFTLSDTLLPTVGADLVSARKYDDSKKKNPALTGGRTQVPSLQVVSIDKETALDYLRGQSITLPPDAPRGLVAVSYKGFVLGLAKNIGNRANNHYPKEWRIKHL